MRPAPQYVACSVCGEPVDLATQILNNAATMPTAKQIQEARAKAGLTQAQAAELVGVERVTWARYELGSPMSPQLFAYFLHVAGLERIPFRKR